MDVRFKKLKFGKIIITTEGQVKEMVLYIEPKEVWELFIRAIKEGKIKTKNE